MREHRSNQKLTLRNPVNKLYERDVQEVFKFVYLTSSIPSDLVQQGGFSETDVGFCSGPSTLRALMYVCDRSPDTCGVPDRDNCNSCSKPDCPAGSWPLDELGIAIVSQSVQNYMKSYAHKLCCHDLCHPCQGAAPEWLSVSRYAALLVS